MRLDCCAGRTVGAELRVGYYGDPSGESHGTTELVESWSIAVAWGTQLPLGLAQHPINNHRPPRLSGRMQNFGAYLLSNTLVWKQPASQPGQTAGVFVIPLPNPRTFGRFVSLQNRPLPGTSPWDQALQVIEMEVYGVALGACGPRV